MIVHLFGDLLALPRRLRYALSLSFGVALVSILSTVFFLFELQADTLLKVYPGILVILLIAAVAKRIRAGTSVADTTPFLSGFTPRHAVVLALILGCLAALGVYTGPLLTYRSDAYDHLSTVRQIEETGSLFPSNTYHVGDVGTGPDPRKGSYHALLALSCLGSGAAPYDLWRLLPALLSPLLVLAVYPTEGNGGFTP